MRVKPAYEIDFYEEDFSRQGLDKMRQIVELAADRPLFLHQIEWPSPLVECVMLDLPGVDVEVIG